MQPPSPWAQVLTLVFTGKGSFPSLKMVYQPTSWQEEDATLDPTCMANRMLLASSWMTMPLDVRGGGFFGGAFKTFGGWLVVHCLLQVWVGEGGGKSDPYLRFVVVALLDGRRVKNG